MNKKAMQQFVFGYGSLICPHSRAVTAPTLAHKTATPVLVKHVERTWAKVSAAGFTAMGVRFQDNAECVGVLLPVDDQELAQFDEREQGYTRVPLYIGDIEQVPFLDSSHYEDPGHQVFLQAKEHPEEHAAQIWMYMPQNFVPASEQTPIVQSYVDTILRGCLTISEDFAAQFIANTKGWRPSEVVTDDEQSVEDDANMSVDSDTSTASSVSDDDVYWVDDRLDPIYSRGDQQYMLKHRHKLDSLLKRHRDEFQHRTRRRK
jgi:hypothetical protein